MKRTNLMFALCVLLGATVAICAVDTFVQGYETVFNLLESLTFLGAMVLWIILQQLISKDIDEDYEYLHRKRKELIKESFNERRKLLKMKQKLSNILFRIRFDYDKMTDEEKEGIEKELDEIDTLS
jgi:anaerobic C4-dicarboxylate transporter